LTRARACGVFLLDWVPQVTAPDHPILLRLDSCLGEITKSFLQVFTKMLENIKNDDTVRERFGLGNLPQQ
jgi:hypothetical protein